MDPQDLTPAQRTLFKYTIGLWLGTAYWLIGVPVDPPRPITRLRRFVSTIRGCVLSVGSFYWGMRAGPLWQCIALVAAALTIAYVTRSMFTPWFPIVEYSDSNKYAAALLRVSANLTEASIEGGRADHAPLVLLRKRPDFLLRYSAFSLATAYYFAPFQRDRKNSLDENARAALYEGMLEAWSRIARMAESDPENGQGLFTQKVDKAYCINEAHRVLLQTIENWNHWGEHIQTAGRDRVGAEMVCTMLHAAESQNPPSPEDLERLMPLALRIEGDSLSIGSAVGQLAR